ncbi:MAG TPA: hypothetical protein VI542_08970 [Candidatus Tectomicrobia bacterium]
MVLRVAVVCITLLGSILLVETQAQQTFYIDNSCSLNGDGTAKTCATQSGGPGAWQSLNASRFCPGMSPGDVIEVRRGTGVYRENTWQPRLQCSGTPSNPTIIQNYPGEDVVLDGTIDIRDSTWTHQGSGVYLCSAGTCGTANKFPFTAWYDTGDGEQRLNLVQTNRTCNATLPPGQMRYTSANQVCVHLDDSSNPTNAIYFRIPFVYAGISLVLRDTDYLTFRRNPKGGSFTITRFRDYGVETNTTNLGIVYDGLAISWVMDRCISQSQGGHQPAAYRIVNNLIQYCGQEGIRWSQDTSPEGLVANNIVEYIQVEPIYERCNNNCLNGFGDTGTAIRTQDTKNGTIIHNIVRNVGGGNKGRAYGIDLQNGAEFIQVRRNFVYNMVLGTSSPNAGHAYLLSDSFNSLFDQVIFEENVAHNVDICFAFDKNGTFPASDRVEYNGNVCSEPLVRGFELQNNVFDGTVSVMNNLFFSNQLTTVNLLFLHHLAPTSANLPSGNQFFCPHCEAIIRTDDTELGPDDIASYGVDNEYRPLPSEFDPSVPSLTVNNTIYVGGGDPIQQTQLIVREVEDYDKLEGGFVERSDAQASGMSYMVVPLSVGPDIKGTGKPLARLHYDVNVPPGTYYFWIRTFGVSGAKDSFFLYLDQGNRQTLHVTRGAWTWHQWPGGSLELDGHHVFTIALREPETRGDKIVITDDPTFVPTGFGPNDGDPGSASQ